MHILRSLIIEIVWVIWHLIPMYMCSWSNIIHISQHHYLPNLYHPSLINDFERYSTVGIAPSLTNPRCTSDGLSVWIVVLGAFGRDAEVSVEHPCGVPEPDHGEAGETEN